MRITVGAFDRASEESLVESERLLQQLSTYGLEVGQVYQMLLTDPYRIVSTASMACSKLTLASRRRNGGPSGSLGEMEVVDCSFFGQPQVLCRLS